MPQFKLEFRDRVFYPVIVDADNMTEARDMGWEMYIAGGLTPYDQEDGMEIEVQEVRDV